MPNNPITLKGFQRKYLRALAHPLKPVVLIGQRGVTDELLKSLDEALNQHELIKLKFIENKNRADKARMLQTLQNAAHVHLVGTIEPYFTGRVRIRKGNALCCRNIPMTKPLESDSGGVYFTNAFTPPIEPAGTMMPVLESISMMRIPSGISKKDWG